jgi:ornithine cyclodeaminase/alanine dehydrogenase-like protein (mu-crystallin family)
MTAAWVPRVREALAALDASARANAGAAYVIGADEALRCAPLDDTIEAVREAVAWDAAGRIAAPESRRAVLRYAAPSGGDGDALRMSAISKCCAVPDLGVAGFRFLGTVGGDDPVRCLYLVGLARHTLLAAIDEHLTYLRRIAALAVVVAEHTVPARAPVVGVIGAGRLARAVIDALVERGRAAEIVVTSRRPASREAFVGALAAAGVARVAAVGSAADVAGRADFLVTATNAAEPVLRAEWVKPGATVYGLGDAVELSDDLLVRSERGTARLIVSNWFECAQRADFRRLIAEGRLDRSHVDAELADVIAGTVPARMRDDDIACVRAPGSVALDVCVGARICARRAEIEPQQTRR